MPDTGITYKKELDKIELHRKALARKDRRHGLVSYHALDTNELLGEEMLPDPGPSVEEIVEQEEEKKAQLRSMWTALTLLPEHEFTLIKKIFLDEIGVRGYSRESGIPLATLDERLQVILGKLQCFTKKL